MKKLLVLVFSCVVLIAASGNVFAASIEYTISGTLYVKFNNNAWELDKRLVTWRFCADTLNIFSFSDPDPTVPDMERIDNIMGTVEIEGLISETALIGFFDIGASIVGAPPGVALSVHEGTPIIYLTNE